MGMTSPPNATPLTYALGTQDLSTREQVAVTTALPTHMPVVWVYAQKGPKGRQRVSGADRVKIYGADSFDLRKKWANHQTVLSNELIAEANAHMIERVFPEDIGPRANFLLSLDVLPTPLPLYQRNSDGSIKKDNMGAPLADASGATVPGFKVRPIVTRLNKIEDEADFGAATQSAGSMTAGETQSTVYPLLQFWASSYGEVFNNSGMKIWAPTEASVNPINSKAMVGTGAYPFRLAVMARSTPTSTGRAVETQNGEQFIEFCLKKGAINTYTDQLFSLQDKFLSSYTNTQNNGFPIDFGHFGGLHVYENNLAELLEMFHAAELAHPAPLSDFDGSAEEMWKFNIFSGVSSKNSPYNTFVVDTASQGTVRLNENTVIYAGGASDGTMSNELFAQLVADSVSEYGNPSSSLLDDVSNPESIVYDTGFPMFAKKALCCILAERKDTAVVLSTYEVDGPEMTPAEEASKAIALKAYLQAYPESDYFGTGTMRGVLLRGYDKLVGSQYKGKLPFTIELAVKAARMMGAGNGFWKEAYVFDRAPNSVLTMFEHNNDVFVPAAARIRDWGNGQNWVEKYDQDSYYFPALQTVTEDDSSVLNSFFTMMLCVELQKVAQRVRRDFSGSVRLTDEQLIDRVNRSVEEKTVGRFCNMYKIVPAATLTAADIARGFSWTLPIKIFANGMKTAMTTYIQAYRMSDYADAQQ